MAVDLTRILKLMFDVAFGWGPPLVRAGVYHRPAAFNSANGEVSVGASIPCPFILNAVRSNGYLGVTRVLPGTEILLVRAENLGGLVPAAGDYVIDENGRRWDVQGSRGDISDQVYSLQVVPSMAEDWGDLATATEVEDWGDLTAAAAFKDRLALN